MKDDEKKGAGYEGCVQIHRNGVCLLNPRPSG